MHLNKKVNATGLNGANIIINSKNYPQQNQKKKIQMVNNTLVITNFNYIK